MMSNNAVADKEKGIVPAYELPIPMTLVAKYFRADTWHHVGKQYYWVPFVQAEKILAFFGLVESQTYPMNIIAAQEYIATLPEEDRARATILRPTVDPLGVIPTEYPYSIDGGWRLEEDLHEELNMPATDEVEEIVIMNLTFRFQKKKKSTPKIHTFPNVRVEKLKSGYWRFMMFVRHPSQIMEYEELESKKNRKIANMTTSVTQKI